MGWLIGLLVVGAAAKFAGGVVGRAEERKAARKQAEQGIKDAEFKRDTALGTMERQLVGNMGEDYLAAGDLENQANTQGIASAQNTFIGQLQAEQDMMDLKASNARSSAELVATQGASGAKQDVNLQTVIDAELQANENAKRSQIDKGLSIATYQRSNTLDAMKTQQNRLESKYDEGSAVRNLYNYQGKRIRQGTTLQTTYLNDVIKDNTYNAGWFAADLLGGFGAAADVGSSLYGLGLLKKE